MDAQERMAYYNVPGVSIAVINDGKLEWARGYGTLEAGGSAPVNAETVFPGGIDQQTRQRARDPATRRLRQAPLDQDVNEVLKSWKVPTNSFTADEKVTLRRMLSHTAGLTVHGFRGYAEGESIPSAAADSRWRSGRRIPAPSASTSSPAHRNAILAEDMW